MTITPDEARALVKQVRAYADAEDHEAAHSAEDHLRRVVLETIAEGVGGARAAELAEIALSTSGIKFHRWCA